MATLCCMILPFKNSGRKKSDKTTSSCIDIVSLKISMRNNLGKTYKVKKMLSDVQTGYYLGVDSALNLAILYESITRFNLQDHFLNL
jgi:hypothetical protein